MDYLKVFNDLLVRATNLPFANEAEKKSIFMDIELYGEKAFSDKKYTRKVEKIDFYMHCFPCSQEAEINAWNDGRDELRVLIETMIKELQLVEGVGSHVTTKPAKNKIFIVHGHDDKLKYEVSNWLHTLEIEPIILHLQPNAGLNSILGKIEDNADVAAAIVLFTGDDLGKAKTETDMHARARQNVVFEAGYFVGKLGPKHVIILHEQSAELPGDLSGIIYTSTDAQWKEDIRKELNHMGLEYKRI